MGIYRNARLAFEVPVWKLEGSRQRLWQEPILKTDAYWYFAVEGLAPRSFARDVFHSCDGTECMCAVVHDFVRIMAEGNLPVLFRGCRVCLVRTECTTYGPAASPLTVSASVYPANTSWHVAWPRHADPAIWDAFVASNSRTSSTRTSANKTVRTIGDA